MLGEFVRTCVPAEHPEFNRIRRALDAAHHALHASFLTYRQYRAFREAIALALLLPPDVKFPATLKVYDSGPGGLYSLRDQIGLLLRPEGQDLSAVLDSIIKTAPHLPETMWDKKYEPFPALTALVDGKRARLFEFAKHTDLVITQQAKVHGEIQRKVATIAYAALVAEFTR